MCEKDANGQYYFEGTRMLVSYLRGDYRPVKNPIKSPYEPAMLVDYFPGPVGVVVAILQDGKIRYGFSKANIWRGDKFNKSRGVEVALNRAMLKQIEPPFDQVHNQDVKEALQRMHTRATHYYKT